MRIEGMDAVIRTNSSIGVGQSQPDIAVKQYAEDKPAPEVVTDNNYKPSEIFIKQAVEKANSTMQQHGRALQFKIHEKTNEVIVKIIDTDTKEVVREIPSEKILDMFANMLELAGLLVDERR